MVSGAYICTYNSNEKAFFDSSFFENALLNGNDHWEIIFSKGRKKMKCDQKFRRRVPEGQCREPYRGVQVHRLQQQSSGLLYRYSHPSN